MRRRDFIALVSSAAATWTPVVAAQQSSDINSPVFARERSFSLIYFAGLPHDALPELLVSCGYSIVGEERHHTSFMNLLNMVDLVEGMHKGIVRKASYPTSGGCVLLDPEMVVAFLHADVIIRFCAQYRADAFVAGWERVSETVFAKHIDAGGVIMDVVSIGGNLQGTPVNPPPAIMHAPYPTGLRDFLASAGASPDELFGLTSARIFKLEETGSLKHLR
jgi:hypothetical protein